MGFKYLPLREDPTIWYDFTTVLDKLSFRFEFLWNEREGAWYFNLYDQQGDMLMAGKKLVPDFPLLMRSVDRRLPPGELTLVDTAAVGANAAMPLFNDLGRRHQLMYTEAAEIAARG